jgi:hypothetical protein
MNWIVANVRWILILCGVLTSTMFYAAIAPEAALQSTFGIIAGAGKAVFVALVLSQGDRYLGHQAGIAVVIDSLMIGVFAWYLFAVKTRQLHVVR